MVLHFSYEKPRKDAIPEMRDFLVKQGFIIKEYAPEDGFMYTDYKVYQWGTGQRLLAVAVHVQDKITITGLAKMDIPVSDLGKPEELLKIKSVDKFPYRIQKRTFLSLIPHLDSLGYKQIEHWP